MNIFPKWFNGLPRIFIITKTILFVLMVFVVWYWFSPKNLDVGYVPEQPIAYSHELHAGQLAIDCRYCHVTVDKSSVASLPSVETCMNCHKLVRNKVGTTEESEEIKKIVKSYESGKGIEWVKVNNLPDYVYFDHSPHIIAGVSCVECHGRVDQMKVVFQADPLSMSSCLECHRNPEASIRPQEFITDLAWSTDDPVTVGEKIIKLKGIAPRENCNTCHR
jgi:hypothetical protein